MFRCRLPQVGHQKILTRQGSRCPDTRDPPETRVRDQEQVEPGKKAKAADLEEVKLEDPQITVAEI